MSLKDIPGPDRPRGVHDLYRERKKASFVVDELTKTIYADNAQRKRAFEIVSNDPAFNVDDVHFLEREDLYEKGLKSATRVIEIAMDKGLDVKDRRSLAAAADVFPNAFGLHSSMFLPTIRGQGNEEQQKCWVPLAENYRIIGSYAQTEIGHGTYVRGIETTATYDPKTEQFVLHTPTLTATKFWPGGMGKTANYVVLIARLITQGKDYGPHTFIVQLRSLEDHTPLPGITVGDIGPKMGGNAVDNGFLRLDHVRIPRMQMLMKNAQVSLDGQYSLRGSPKLVYGTMVYARATFCRLSGLSLAQGVTIAIRYSAVRRQTQPRPGAEELQLLDYQTQQYKLLPLVAAAYAATFAGDVMLDLYAKSVQEFGKQDFSSLPELHATSAGMKAVMTDLAVAGIDTCRRCCGGHGYLAASGLPTLYSNSAPSTTYEGDNTVLLLQTARFLVKRAAIGGDLPKGLRYLADKQDIQIKHSSDLMKFGVLVGLYEKRARNLIKSVALKYQLNQKRMNDDFDAWNASSVELVSCAKAHCQLFAVKAFTEVAETKGETPGVKSVLKLLADLFAVHGIVEEAGTFLQTGALTPHQIEMAHQQMLELLKTIRPQAVALVDAFDFSDRTLCSVLGRYDGDVYTHLFEWSKNSPLNKKEVLDGYYKYLRPLMKRKSKL